MSGPAPQRPRQRREQHVVDPGPVRGRHLLDQSPRLRRGELHEHRVQRGHVVDPSGVVHRQRRRRPAHHLAPVLGLRLQGTGPRIRRQPLRPVTDGRRLRRQVERLAQAELLAAGQQVLDQYPPRDAVHREVVNHHEQPLPAAAHLEQSHPDQGALREVEAPLQLGGGRFQRIAVTSLRHGAQIHTATNGRRRLLRARIDLLPAPLCVRVPEAQGIVVDHHLPDDLVHRAGINRSVDVQQDRLIEVVRLGELLLEEPALDRRERHRTFHEPLLGVDGETTWIARIESPPSWKKLSWMPTRSKPSASAQVRASSSSNVVRGARYASSISARAPGGAGSARRSTFPVPVNGRASSHMKVDGTM